MVGLNSMLPSVAAVTRLERVIPTPRPCSVDQRSEH
jgi:hypothetical protein